MNPLSRRSFLEAATGAGVSARSRAQVAGANGDIRVAIVGLNSRSRDHLKAFGAMPGVRGLCDKRRASIGRTKTPEAEPATVTIYDYATAPLIFEVRGLPAKPDALSAINDGSVTGAAAAQASAGATCRSAASSSARGGWVAVPSADYSPARAFGRMSEHLAANGVNLETTPAALGRPRTLAVGAERFTGEDSAAANALLTREYRKPFVVSEIS